MTSSSKKSPRVSTKERVRRAEEWDDFLVCRICGFKSKFSLISHITRTHKIAMSEYRQKFPNCIVQRSSRQQRNQQSKTQKRRLSNPDDYQKMREACSSPSEIRHWIRQGYSKDAAIEKVSEHQTTLALRQNNPGTKRIQSKQRSGDNNPMSLRSIAERECVTIEEASKLTPCYRRTGKAHPMFGKTHTEEARQKIAKNMTHSWCNVSRPEADFRDALREYICQHFNSNFALCGYNIDIVMLEEKIAIEFFGNFWHAHPNDYDDEYVHPFIKKTAKEIRERDAQKIAKLEDAGYDVIIIWESDWKSNSEQILREVKNAVDSKTRH